MPPFGVPWWWISMGVVVLPASVYGGMALKEHLLARELGPGAQGDRATQAMIVQLAKERMALLKERKLVDAKIVQAERALELERANQVQ